MRRPALISRMKVQHHTSYSGEARASAPADVEIEARRHQQSTSKMQLTDSSRAWGGSSNICLLNLDLGLSLSLWHWELKHVCLRRVYHKWNSGSPSIWLFLSESHRRSSRLRLRCYTKFKSLGYRFGQYRHANGSIQWHTGFETNATQEITEMAHLEHDDSDAMNGYHIRHGPLPEHIKTRLHLWHHCRNSQTFRIQ